MKIFLKEIFNRRFVIVLLGLFLVFDSYAASQRLIENSMFFEKNDYDKTLMYMDGETEYDKVFYGNSVLTTSYRQEDSISGYVNLGIVYGTIIDLRDMIDKKYITINEDLVILANRFLFMDTLPTNETYPWKRGKYEPYFWFERDVINPFVHDYVKMVLETKSFDINNMPVKSTEDKYLVFGSMTDEELDENIEYNKEKYWGLSQDKYDKNFEAFQEVIDYCKANDIRLRVVLAGWNPYVEMPESFVKVTERIRKVCEDNDIEVLDYTYKFPRECFHDLGHFDYDYGAVEFTKEIDKWLIK